MTDPDTTKASLNAKVVRDVFKRLASTTANPRTMTAALALAFADDCDLDVVFRSIR
jgi:hypothetical protein